MVLEQNIQFHQEAYNCNIIQLNDKSLTVSGKIQDLEFKQNLPVNIIFSDILCSTCSKHRANYYEAIIQIRSNFIKFNDFSKNFANYSNITKIEFVKNGIDFYFFDAISGKNTAYQLAKKYHTKVISSKKLCSKNKYKFTYLIRI